MWSKLTENVTWQPACFRSQKCGDWLCAVALQLPPRLDTAYSSSLLKERTVTPTAGDRHIPPVVPRGASADLRPRM